MLPKYVEVEGIVAEVLIVHRHVIGRCSVQDVNDGARSGFASRSVIKVMSAGEAETETTDGGAEYRHRAVLCDEFRTRFNIIDRAIRILEGVQVEHDGILTDALELVFQLIGIEHRGIDILEAVVREIGFDFLHPLEVTESGIGFIVDGHDRIRIRKKLRRNLDRSLQVKTLDVTGDVMIVHRAACVVEVIDAHEDHRTALEEVVAIAETELQCRIIGEDDGVEGVLIPVLIEKALIDILEIALCRVIAGIHELLGEGDVRVLVEDLLDAPLLIRHGDEAPAVRAQVEDIGVRKRRLLHGGSRRIRSIGRVVEVLDEHHEATEDQAD